MHHAGHVGRLDAAGDLGHEARRLARVERPPAAHAPPEVPALDVLVDDEVLVVVGDAEVDHAHDVEMVDPSRLGRLVDDAMPAPRRAVAPGEHLDRDEGLDGPPRRAAGRAPGRRGRRRPRRAARSARSAARRRPSSARTRTGASCLARGPGAR